MKKNKTTLIFTAILSLGVLAPFAAAAENDGATSMQSVSYNGMANNGEIRFLSGGVGDESLQAINTVKSNFDLKMVFVNEAHAYLANLDVTVMDPTGNHVFETKTDGPILLANLPAGRYTIVARTEEGVTETRRVDVHAGHQAEYIMSYPSI